MAYIICIYVLIKRKKLKAVPLSLCKLIKLQN